MRRLFDSGNAWTKEALRIHADFAQLTEKFIKEHPDIDARDLEYTLNSAVNRGSLEVILEKRRGG